VNLHANLTNSNNFSKNKTTSFCYVELSDDDYTKRVQERAARIRAVWHRFDEVFSPIMEKYKNTFK
jgi:hypothetical protein